MMRLTISDATDCLRFRNMPRRYHLNSNPHSVPQLHCFGAVTYLKHGHEIPFAMAKTQVAPVKKLTLLELMAALIGSRLLFFKHNAIESQYETMEVHLWPNRFVLDQQRQGT